MMITDFITIFWVGLQLHRQYQSHISKFEEFFGKNQVCPVKIVLSSDVHQAKVGFAGTLAL